MFSTNGTCQFVFIGQNSQTIFLREGNGQPSCPIVGLLKWGTTPTSKVFSTVGTILSQCDGADDPAESPLKDTNDRLLCIQHMNESHAPHANDLVMSKSDFDSMYANITWQDMSDTGWRVYCFDLSHASTFLTLEEKEFASFMFILLTCEQLDAFALRFPFA